MDNDTIKDVIELIIGAGACLYILNSTINPVNKNPQTFNPREISFKVKDVCGDKAKETVMKYHGKEYLMEKDNDGMPKFYKIETLTMINSGSYTK